MQPVNETERLKLYIEATSLNRLTDAVLSYRPPAKAKATAKREKRRAKRAAKKG